MEANVEKNTTLNNIEGKVVSIPVIDKTLTKSDRSADAKVTGDEISRLDERLDNIDPHFATNVQYDNASSGLSAINTQGAIDEIMTEHFPAEGVTKVNKAMLEEGGVGETLFSITDRNDSGIKRYISISDKTKTEDLTSSLKYVEKDNDTYKVGDIFGAHNKPIGYYTGNGSATAREIEVGGVGGVIIIYSNNAGNLNICLVTKIGAVAFTVGGTSRETKYMSSAVIYRDGKLTLATAEDSVNANNVNYYYQVL